MRRDFSRRKHFKGEVFFVTVKEIIVLAAEMAGESEAVKFNDGKAPENSEYAENTTKLFKRCFDVVTDELAAEYYPLKDSQKFFAKGGKVAFSDFEKTPLSILNVSDENGKKCAYKFVNDYLSVKKEGKITVEYTYRPKPCNMEDRAVYSESIIGPHVLCYGILSEFFMRRGNFSESEVWHNKYISGIKGRIAERRKLKISARRWI